MSITLMTYPVQAALPGAQYFFSNFFAIARPVFGAGALMTVYLMFKPLITGFMHAVRLMFSPRHTLEERNSRRTLAGVLMLNRMARELDHSDPSQAAELRLLAGRS